MNADALKARFGDAIEQLGHHGEGVHRPRRSTVVQQDDGTPSYSIQDSAEKQIVVSVSPVLRIQAPRYGSITQLASGPMNSWSAVSIWGAKERRYLARRFANCLMGPGQVLRHIPVPYTVKAAMRVRMVPDDVPFRGDLAGQARGFPDSFPDHEERRLGVGIGKDLEVSIRQAWGGAVIEGQEHLSHPRPSDHRGAKDLTPGMEAPPDRQNRAPRYDGDERAYLHGARTGTTVELHISRRLLQRCVGARQGAAGRG